MSYSHGYKSSSVLRKLSCFSNAKPARKFPVEALIKCLYEMKRKAHGAQEPRHINRIVEVASAAQRSDSLAQVFYQRFPGGPRR